MKISALTGFEWFYTGCCGYWCGLCQIEQTADRLEISDSWLGDNCWLSISLLCLVPCFPIFILRQKTREKFGIDGSCCGDATVAICCGCCANIQMATELDDRGVPKYW